MDRIYSGARFTAVMLEDVEMTAEEHEFIKSSRRRLGQERERFLTLVRRILDARWFGRAWCSQEFLLGRGIMFYMHQSGNPQDPIAFAIDALSSWVTKARIYDANIPRLSERRGVRSMNQSIPDFSFVGSFAWAYGLVQAMGCYNVYDKIALVLNLVRTPLNRRLTAFPTSVGTNANADLNVAKVVNVLAIRNKDFSLLQTGHQPDRSLQDVDGFGWATLPVKGDVTAEMWHARIFEVDKDPGASISPAGIMLKGLLDRIVAQQDWSIRRQDDNLCLTVNGKTKVIQPDWLVPSDEQTRHDATASHDPSAGLSAYDREPPMAKLRDLLYAIEAFNAVEIWPTFMPADENWTLRTQDDGFRSYNEGSLRVRILKEYVRPNTTQRTMAVGASFLYGDHETRFNVITLASEFRMVVGGNIVDMRGRDIFQPFVMRINEFGAHGVACNAFILRDAPAPKSDVRRVVGHIRSFQLVPADAEVQTITLR